LRVSFPASLLPCLLAATLPRLRVNACMLLRLTPKLPGFQCGMEHMSSIHVAAVYTCWPAAAVLCFAVTCMLCLYRPGSPKAWGSEPY
jgi:hypothetical protein